MKTKDLKFGNFEVNKISNTQLRTINGGGDGDQIIFLPTGGHTEPGQLGGPKNASLSTSGGVSQDSDPKPGTPQT